MRTTLVGDGRPGAARVKLLVAVLALALPASSLAADPSPAPGLATVTLPDGRLQAGRIEGTDRTGFRFVPEGEGSPIDLAELTTIHFGSAPSGPIEPTESPAPFRVDLNRRGRLSGRLESITPAAVHLVLDHNSEPLAIERAGVRAVVQRPGEFLVLADGFESLDSPRWAAVGMPDVVPEPVLLGQGSLRLSAGGSAVTARLDEPVASGRFEVAYHDDGLSGRGCSWLIDLSFRGADGPVAIQVLPGGEEKTLGVRTRGAGPALAVQPLERRPGWHRLVVRFGAERTDVTLDGLELAHGAGPGGPLIEIRLADASPGNLPGNRALYLDDLRLVRFAEPVGPTETDPTQDEVRLVTGDQLFGTLRSADPEQVRFEMEGRSLNLDWSEVAGVELRRQTEPSEPLAGLWVRLRWYPEGSTASAEDADHLEGVLESFDTEATCVLAPYIGRVAIPTTRLAELTVVGHSRRVVLDPAHRHLGNRLVSDLDPAQPEGSDVEVRFALAEIPAGAAVLTFDVVQIVGIEGDLLYSMQVRNGELRTFVGLNGQRLGDLNSLVTVRNDTPLRVRLPVPSGRLQLGTNMIRFEQIGTKDNPNLVDNFGLLGIGLESPIPEGGGPDQP